ncbi:outer membrane lipoprotein carrier protein LolA [Candidatus Neomarinimicrobiota bacterium]
MKQQIIFIVLITIFINLSAQGNNKSSASIFPTAESVLDSLEKKYNQIEDYYVRIDISIKTPMLRMPKKRVEFWFKKPNLKKIETKGFAAIPKSGIITSPVDIFDNLSDLAVVGAEYFDDKQVWILQGRLNPDSLTFKKMSDMSSAPNLEMRLLVDRSNWTLIKSETWMDTSKVVEIETEYGSVAEDIYLPKETIISFEYLGVMSSGREDTFGAKHQFGSQQGDSQKNGISGMITLKFSDYKVNKGINDTFFVEEKQK